MKAKLLVFVMCLAGNLSTAKAQSWSQLGSDIQGSIMNDKAGEAVAINDDGTVIAIGAKYFDGNSYDNGQVRVYHYFNNTWQQLGSDIIGTLDGGRSGWSLSLNSAGDILAVGAPDMLNYASEPGHVKIFQYNGNDWIQLGNTIYGENNYDMCGFSVSLNGTGYIVAVASPYSDNNGFNSGQARIFGYDAADMTWTQMGSNIEGDNTYDFFGLSLSVDYSGGNVAIGATHNGDNGFVSGHVKVFTLLNGNWMQRGSTIAGDNAGDYIGLSISMSGTGERFAFGTAGNYYVKAYEYDQGSADWVIIGNSIYGDNIDDGFGVSVSLNFNGDFIAIGAPYNANNGYNAGQIKVFEEITGTGWVQLGQDLYGDIYGEAGTSVAINDNGEIITFGAPIAAGVRGVVKTFKYDAFSGINSYGVDNISLFPNPASELIEYRVKEADGIEIYNSSGVLMQKKINVNETGIIDVSSFTNGLYIFRVYSTHGVFNERFVIY